MTGMPTWVIFHVPHDSTVIPSEVRSQFTLSDEMLAEELLAMTDHKTLKLFGQEIPSAQVIRAPVSRLVVDVERFEVDELEPMASRGMGVVYMRAHDGKELRYPVTSAERERLIEDWYRPHHEALTRATESSLLESGLAVVIDCHSFPADPLPYEIDQAARRPQICIGTDAFHTPQTLVQFLKQAIEKAGYEVGLDSPFSGSMVPNRYFKQDRRVFSVMLEVRRDMYLDKNSDLPNAEFEQIRRMLRRCLLLALHSWYELEFNGAS